MRRGAGGNAIVRPRRVMPTPATVTRRPRTRRLCFVARSCSPQSSSGVADARLSRLVMVATSHCLGLRPCVEVVDMILDEAAVQPEDRRSEEHTSELQSLMRISYAVFCLKKKKK